MRLFRVFFVVFLLLAGNGLAQDKPAATGRYYTGIGIQFYRIINSNVRFGCSKNVTCHNENGQLTGLVIITRVIENSPAAQAGLEQGDLIEVVEGKNVVVLSSDELLKIIREGAEGSILHLTVRKFHDETLSEEFGAEVVRGKIDRVGFVPLGQTMRSEMSGGNYYQGAYWLTFESKVFENKKDNTFHYQYQIRNKGKIGVLVRWRIVERMIFGKPDGQWEDDFNTFLIVLKPGQSKKFDLVSKDLPTFYSGEVGKVSVLAKASDNFLWRLKAKQDRRLNMEPKNVLTYLGGRTETPAFIPETLASEEPQP